MGNKLIITDFVATSEKDEVQKKIRELIIQQVNNAMELHTKRVLILITRRTLISTWHYIETTIKIR